MTAQVGEVAMRVWQVLQAHYRQHLGPQTVTEMMLAGDLSRAEVKFGLQELAAGGWVWRNAVERDGKIIEIWQIVERQPQQQRDRGRVAAE
jgi:hypothetical protein